MKDEAVRPKFINPLIPTEEEVEEQADGPTSEELKLFSLSKNGGWKHFRGVVTEELARLDQINVEAISGGASMEEIGRNTLVITMVKDVINHLFNRVDDAVEACNNEEK